MRGGREGRGEEVFGAEGGGGVVRGGRRGVRGGKRRRDGKRGEEEVGIGGRGEGRSPSSLCDSAAWILGVVSCLGEPQAMLKKPDRLLCLEYRTRWYLSDSLRVAGDQWKLGDAAEQSLKISSGGLITTNFLWPNNSHSQV
ncbi:unnamed protein product [Pleuronectes platessa]|uniref:Uncharacterized protein n=1 Tax=Pleuronectes platessa TaxID=8262 RepID=A0A9N7TNV8_PLEPL|nr:unnamed protein product [Pleuronectes platessa]